MMHDGNCPHCHEWMQLNRVDDLILSVSLGPKKKGFTYADLKRVGLMLAEQAYRSPEVKVTRLLPYKSRYPACDVETKQEVFIEGLEVHAVFLDECYYVSPQYYLKLADAVVDFERGNQ
jgi:hypothetical protein